jgi:ELWxxDGT repeat protein
MTQKGLVMKRFGEILVILFVCMSLMVNRVTSNSDPQPILLKDINPGIASSVPYGFLYLNGRTVFIATNVEHGSELWSTDGTPEGTGLFKEINPLSADGIGFATSLESQGVMNGVLYFTGTDPQHGDELWRTNGTPEGTWMVKDIRPGTNGSNPGNFINANGTIFFMADDGVHGWELWKTDGSGSGTVFVKDVISGQSGLADGHPKMGVLGSTLIFSVNDFFNTGTFQLWRSNGTQAGTVPFFGPYSFGLNSLAGTDSVRYMLNNNGLLYLNVNDYRGDRLWVTDGTAQGTHIIDAGAPPEGSEYTIPCIPDQLTWLGNDLYFTARDITANGNALGYGIWKHTAGSLTAVQVIGPLDNGPVGLTRLNLQQMVYWSYKPSSSKFSLWRTDGTIAGTENICPDCFGDFDYRTATMVGKVYFPADGLLWFTDGTGTGTGIIPGLIPARQSYSRLNNFTVASNRLFLAADEGTHGYEPWFIQIELGNKTYLPVMRR